MKKRKKRGCLFPLLSWALVLFIIFSAFGAITKRLFPLPYRATIEAAAAENELPPSLLYAVIKAESNFKPGAVSKKGAQGLMQLMESTAAWCSEKSGLPLGDILNPAENIALGAFYLGYLCEMYGGNVETALAAYNAGYGRVNSWLRDADDSAEGQTLSSIPFPETRQYVKKVMLYNAIYEKRLEKAR